MCYLRRDVQWYPRYPGDYGRDTGHLSLLEHGAYIVLLDAFYATERSIPHESRFRLTRAIEPAEQRAVDRVLEEFWIRTEHGWANRRALAEIEKSSSKRAAAARAARQRWERTNADAPANASPAASPRGSPLPSPKRRQHRYSEAFETFWAAWPRERRTGKGAAGRKWEKLEPPLERCLEVLERLKATAQWQRDGGQFIPLPATWLGQRRWEDDVPEPPAEDAGDEWDRIASRLNVRDDET